MNWLRPVLFFYLQYTNFLYNIQHKLTSEKGYSLGARTSQRIPKIKAVSILHQNL